MTRLRRRRAERTRRRTRVLLLAALIGITVMAVAFFAAGLVLPGMVAVLAGLANLVAAGRHARPANWTAEDRDTESR